MNAKITITYVYTLLQNIIIIKLNKIYEKILSIIKTITTKHKDTFKNGIWQSIRVMLPLYIKIKDYTVVNSLVMMIEIFYNILWDYTDTKEEEEAKSNLEKSIDKTIDSYKNKVVIKYTGETDFIFDYVKKLL